MRVVTSKQMKAIETSALNYGLTWHQLMENAGCAAAQLIGNTFRVAGLNCIVFCGHGNNGGDGFVVARKLREHGVNVLMVTIGGEPRSNEAKAMFSSAKMMDIPVMAFEQNANRVLGIIGNADILVDGIYGTGFHGNLSESLRPLFAAINNAVAAVVALDIPSGVNADTGEADPDAIRADFCVTFDSYKPAHVQPDAQPFCGKIELADIGIPDEARENLPAICSNLTTEAVFSLLPKRDPQAHKGSHGKVLAICGSARFRGAAVFAASGALRCGAGLVTVASTEMVCQTVATHRLEPVYLPLPANEQGGVAPHAAELLTPAIQESTAILFGCGMGMNSDTAALLTHLLRKAACPVIIDADGINTLAQNIHELQEANAPIILTPHPKEMARLTGCPVEEIQQDRPEAASRLAQKHGVVVVLKGHETVIAAPDGDLLLNRTGNAGLAKGGSGDILAGMIAAFAAQGLRPKDAAACAVHLHGLAADRTAARRSQYGMLPSELLDDLTTIFLEAGR